MSQHNKSGEAQIVQLYKLLTKLQLASKTLNSRDLKDDYHKTAVLNSAYLKRYTDAWFVTFSSNCALLFARLQDFLLPL